nr:ATP-binding protein [uncultured Flavobacterium sp.]
MKPAFHYAVRIKLFNYLNKDEVDFIEHFIEFSNDNPILAREEAFKTYQNWLDVLLEGIGKEYTTDKQAREDLQTYLKPNIDLNIAIGENIFDLSNSLSVGIGVYFVIDVPEPPLYRNDLANDHEGDEWLIHGIGNSLEFNDPTNFSFYLEEEFGYYRGNDYDFKNYEREASCFNHESQEVDDFEYLDTPFKWKGLYDPTHPSLMLTYTNNYESIIENGEGEVVEFKPSLSYHFSLRTWQGKYEVNYIIAKAICAFLNSKGGMLFIGVKDNGEVQGLDYDFNLSKKENKIDYFKLDFDRVLENFIGPTVIPIVNIELTEINGKQLCVVKIEPSNEPVFLKAQENQKEFWVRANASNRQINDIDKILSYWANLKREDSNE